MKIIPQDALEKLEFMARQSKHPHLLRQGETWYAYLEIPADVREQFNGKRRFKQSLATRDVREAEAKKWPLITQWKAEVAAARTGNGRLMEALCFREDYQRAATPDQQELVWHVITDRADEITASDPEARDILKAYRMEPDPEAVNEPLSGTRGYHEAQRFFRLATGLETPIESLIETWLSDHLVEDKTADQHRSAMKLLLDRHQVIEEIDRLAAHKFIDEVLKPGRKPATVNRLISTYSRFWSWLIDRGYLPDERRNPWEKQRLPLRGRKARGTAEGNRRPFTEDEAVAFLEEVSRWSHKHSDDLPVAQLQAVTGMRADEAASLRVGDVREGEDRETIWIKVSAGKTAAAIRTIPVVDKAVVEALRQRLAGKSGDDWVFDRLKPDRYGNRAQALSKRLNRRLDQVSDDRDLAANHSWRHRARTLMERAGVDPWVADWIVGHSRPGEGLGRYSRGPSEGQLVAAVKTLTLPT